MKRFISKAASSLLALVIIAGVLGGCSGERAHSEAEPVMGRYIEEEAAMPEGHSHTFGVFSLADGTIRLYGMTQDEQTKIWTSQDGARSWDQGAALPDEFNQGYITDIDMNEAGVTLISLQTEEQQSRLYQLSADGELGTIHLQLPELEVPEEFRQDMEDTDLSNGIQDLKITADGKLLVMDYNSRVHVINGESGVPEQTFETEGESPGFIVIGNRLMIMEGHSALQQFDLTSGEPLPADRALDDQLAQNDTSMTERVYGAQAALFHAGDSDDSLYFCSNRGLFRHVFDGTVTEEIIDGKLNTLGNPSTCLYSMAMVSREEFLILAETDSGSTKLFRYSYSKDVPTRPSKEIGVYALTDNPELRQVISMFQIANPDYYIALEIGMSQADGVTAADAIRTLNTDILAGNGPDVLLLDGMPVQSYIDRGLLADITELVAEVEKTEGLFENITGAFETDGVYYALPTRVTIPLINADEATLEQVADLNVLADQVVELRAQDKEVKTILGPGPAGILAEKLFQSYSPALLNTNGTIEAENLENFYIQLKRIHDTSQALPEEMEEAGSTGSISEEMMPLVLGEARFAIGELNDMDTIAQMNGTNKYISGFSYELLETAGQKVFGPKSQIGINSKSTRVEDAEVFVAYLFGKAAQQINREGGLPVNRAAFEALRIDKNADYDFSGMMFNDIQGNQIKIAAEWPTAEQFDGIVKMVESLDTPAVTDRMIREAVMAEVDACASGSTSPAEAAAAVSRKVDLYLAE